MLSVALWCMPGATCLPSHLDATSWGSSGAAGAKKCSCLMIVSALGLAASVQPLQGLLLYWLCSTLSYVLWDLELTWDLCCGQMVGLVLPWPGSASSTCCCLLCKLSLL